MKTLLAAAAALSVTAALAAQAPSPDAIDRTTLHVQVILDRIGFGPGVIDGRGGESLKLALRGFQERVGIEPTGKVDRPTLAALNRFRAIRPTLTARLGAEDVAGPYVRPFPKDPKAQAKLSCLCYRSALERIAERFHTTPETLIALNNPDTVLKPGARITVPGVVPSSRDYKSKDEKQRALLNAFNIDAQQPEGDRVVVDKSDGVLRVFSGERLVAQFPATMGSERDPLPLGTWTIKGASYLPPWKYQPAILKKANQNDPELDIKPGPNSPVGVAWLDLSKEHYGIHGTAEPQTVGRAESNGCIRLTNWDVMRLSLMVKPGTKAIFQE